MNSNKDVVVFTMAATFILLTYSIFEAVHPGYFGSLRRVSIVSDLVRQPSQQPVASDQQTVPDSPAVQEAPRDTLSVARAGGKHSLIRYATPRIINSFSPDTTRPSLPAFMTKLLALKHGKKGKIRIAWFGDSMIEGDLLSQTFRKKMQQYFGGRYGVGFIPANSVTAAFRNTASHKWTGDWREENFKTRNPTSLLFLSGHTYFTSGGSLSIRDKTIEDTTQPVEKSLLCGQAAGGIISITVNGQPRQFKADKLFNRILLDTSASHSIDLQISNDKLPVYGVSLEPESGIVVDNFSFRGIAGVELAKLDSVFLRTLTSENPYDLVILEYGTNVLYQPGNTDFSWYRRCILPVIRKLRNEMPESEFLIISAADRAFQYDQTWKTAVGMDNLVRTQAELACANDEAFFNMFTSMGGAGTIVNWADSTPALANKDYIHPTFRGADILGNILFDAFMKDYSKADRAFNAGAKTAKN